VSGWDELSKAQRAAVAYQNRRTHSAVNREFALKLEDERSAALGEAVDWLAANGFADASAALEAAAFEPSVSR